MNSFTVTGNIGKDPEEIVTAKATFTSASLAWNTKDRQGEKVTTWLKLNVFGKPGEWFLRDVKKGTRVTVQGELDVEKWTGKDGKENTTLVVNVRQYERSAAKLDDAPVAAKTVAGESVDDDIPFAPGPKSAPVRTAADLKSKTF